MSLAADRPHPGGRPPGLDENHPWPGLLSFDEDDRRFFRGRDREAVELYRRVMRHRLTLLFGRSGLGKTSLLRAGLFPRLRSRDLLPVYIRLDYAAGSPELRDQVLTAIASHAAAAEVDCPPASAAASLWEHFHRRDADYWSPRHRPVTPVLVFDQFEEIFTLGRSRAAETGALVAELADLAQGRPPASLRERLDRAPAEARAFAFDRHPYKILLSLREDFLAQLEELRRGNGKGSWRGLFDNRFRLRSMDGDNALEAVAQCDLASPEVARRIVRFVAASEEASGSETPLAELVVDPALLSVICSKLNERRLRRGDDRISAADVEGSREEILDDFYRQSVGDLGPEVAVFLEERLLTLGGHRNRMPREDALAEPGITPEVLETLRDRRLLQVEERAGVRWLELTHDRLTSVIAKSRKQRRRRESRERAETAHREELARAARQAQEEAERAYQRRRLWLARAAAGVLGVLFLGAALLGVWTYRQSRVERRLAIQRTATAAALAVEREPRRALRLAREAVESSLASTGEVLPAAEAALHQALEAVRMRPLWTGGPDGREADEAPLALTADGRYLAAALAGGSVSLWETETGGPPRRLSSAGEVSGLALSPNGRYLAAVGRGGEVRFWDLAAGRERRDLGWIPEGVWWVGFSPAGDRLTVADESSLQLLGWPDGEPVFEAPHDPRRPSDLYFGPDGSRFATGTGDGGVTIVDAATGTQRRTLFDPRHPAFPPAAIDAAGQRLATGSDSAAVRVWDIPTGRLLTSLLGSEPTLRLAFDPDSLYLASAGAETVSLWELESGSRLFLQGPGPARPALLSADGCRLVTRGEAGLAVWELIYEPMPSLPHGARVRAVRFDRLGESVATLDWQGTVRLWEVATRGLRAELSGAATGARAMALHPAGRLAAVATSDGEAALWDLEAATLVTPLGAAAGKVTAIVFDASGERLATGSGDGRIAVYEIGSAGPAASFDGHEGRVRALAFDPRGRLASAGDDALVRLWTASGELLATDSGHAAAVYALAFDPRGRRLASGGRDGSIRLWQIGSDDPSVPLDGVHDGQVRALAFSPDGLRLASGGTDGLVVTWHAKRLIQLFVLKGRVVNGLDYSPDGRYLAIASHGHGLRLQLLDPAELLALARQREGVGSGR